MAKAKFKIADEVEQNLDEVTAGDDPKEQTEPKRNMSENSLANLNHGRPTGTAKPKAFMQLNIHEHEDYIYRMSKVQNKTMTQYVLDLIQADKKANEQAYEGLKLIKTLDKPPRKAKNKKK